MSIVIDKSKCIGCKRCRNVCPGSLIKTDENGKAYIKYPKDCWGCTSCIKECPAYAISFSSVQISAVWAVRFTPKRTEISSRG